MADEQIKDSSNRSEQQCEDCPENPKQGDAAAGTVQSSAAARLDECMGRSLEELSDAFRSSARRWELIVYPSLLAFIILAGYGFFLIYSLTKDVSAVARNMESITANMEVVAERMASVSGDMKAVSNNMHLVAVDVRDNSESMDQMVAEMRDMKHSMRSMDVGVDRMQRHFGVMNRSVARPMSFMNSFFPW